MKMNLLGVAVGVVLFGFGSVSYGQSYSNASYSFTTLADPNATPYGYPDVFPPYTIAQGINNSGQVVGSYLDGSNGWGVLGFVYSNGTYNTLSNPYNTLSNPASGINDNGLIVGQISIADSPGAC